MLKKLNQLSFVIGLFFILVAIILLVGYLLGASLKQPINLYSCSLINTMKMPNTSIPKPE